MCLTNLILVLINSTISTASRLEISESKASKEGKYQVCQRCPGGFSDQLLTKMPRDYRTVPTMSAVKRWENIGHGNFIKPFVGLRSQNAVEFWKEVNSSVHGSFSHCILPCKHIAHTTYQDIFGTNEFLLPNKSCGSSFANKTDAIADHRISTTERRIRIFDMRTDMTVCIKHEVRVCRLAQILRAGWNAFNIVVG